MDYAKKNKQPPTKSKVPVWVWFITGVVTGTFLTFLYFLSGGLADRSMPDADNRPTPKIVRPGQISEDLKLEFYDIFPRTEVPLVEEYIEEGDKQTVENQVYILQVGSFRSEEDADALRARLILLGLDAYIKQGEVRGDFWHRVLVGPIKSDLALNRAQDRLAEEGIEAIPLKLEPR